MITQQSRARRQTAGSLSMHIPTASAFFTPGGAMGQIDVFPVWSLPVADEHTPRWSPDGKKIAYVSNNKIEILNADGSNLGPAGGAGTPLVASRRVGHDPPY